MTKLPNTITEFLTQPYELTQEQIDFYQKYRYIKLKEVLNQETLMFFNDAISGQVNLMNQEDKAPEERTTYGKAFLQLFNLWIENNIVKAGNIYTLVWFTWNGIGKKTQTKVANPGHIIFKWENDKISVARFSFDPTALKEEIAASQKK